MWEYLISFFITSIILVVLVKMGGIGNIVVDHNKPKPRKVPKGGGIAVLISVSLIYFFWGDRGYIIYGVAGMLLILMLIGIYDDMRGIKKWRKVPVALVGALPVIIAYLIAQKNLWAPTIIGINFSYFYWFAVIPIVIAGFANGGNVIAGYDGMETGIYALISALYLFIGAIVGNELIIFLSGILFFSLIPMLLFNWYPSKILLGNSGSFGISAFLGLIPLIGHFEVVLPVIFAPHLLEVYLQLKYTSKYDYDVFGRVDEDGIIHNKYGKRMSIIHWLISWGNMSEKKITIAMLGIESLLCTMAFFIWYLSVILH